MVVAEEGLLGAEVVERGGIRALTAWAHERASCSRIWLEINADNAPSLRLAQRAGYRLEQRLPRHCRVWTSDDPDRDTWHDCLIWVHTT